MVTQPAKNKKEQLFPKNVCCKVGVKKPCIGLEETKNLGNNFQLKAVLLSSYLLEKQNSFFGVILFSERALLSSSSSPFGTISS